VIVPRESNRLICVYPSLRIAGKCSICLEMWAWAGSQSVEQKTENVRVELKSTTVVSAWKEIRFHHETYYQSSLAKLRRVCPKRYFWTRVFDMRVARVGWVHNRGAYPIRSVEKSATLLGFLRAQTRYEDKESAFRARKCCGSERALRRVGVWVVAGSRPCSLASLDAILER
jgi:hypothetical protein